MFKNMKLVTKIGAGFAVLVLLTMVISFVGWNGTRLIVNKTEISADANQMIKLILEARRHEKNFIIRADSEYIKKVNDLLAQLENQALTTKNKINANIEKKNIDQIVQNLEKYSTSFNKYVELSHARQKAAQDMRKAAANALAQTEAIRLNQKEQMEEIMGSQTDFKSAILVRKKNQKIIKRLTKGDDANRLIKWFLDVQKNEKEFIISGDNEYVEKVNTRIGEILMLAEDLQLRFRQKANLEQIQIVIEDIQKYEKLFSGFSNLYNEQLAAEKLMVQAAKVIIELCNHSVEAQKKSVENYILLNNVIIIVVSVIVVLFGVFISFLVATNIIRQLGCEPHEIADVAGKVSKGDLEIHFEDNNEDQESVYYSVKTMVNNLQNTASLAERIASGDLTVDVTLLSEKDTLGLSLSEMVKKLQGIVSEINDSANSVAIGARQLSSISQAMAQGTTNQASSIEEISSSMEEISSQIRHTAQNADQTDNLVNKTKENAERGNSEMDKMTAAMDEIEQSSNNVSKIIKVIDEIAFQTNLLALNAAVEAARAGKYGKGFAVVAEEVRNLAARSAKAAKETGEMIEGSVKKVEEGTQITNQTAEAFKSIVTSIEKVADLVNEIATASKQQSQGASQISQGIAQIDQVTQANTAHAEESASASEELSGQAEMLQELISAFKLTKMPMSMIENSAQKADVLTLPPASIGTIKPD